MHALRVILFGFLLAVFPILLGIVSAALIAVSVRAGLTTDPADDVQHDDGLNGREIYDRVVEHRIRSFFLEAELENGNGKGDARRLAFRMIWKDYRAEHPKVTSKTKIELDWPFELRFGGVKIEKTRGKPAQYWAYIPETRIIFRLPLRDHRFHGSAFSFDDIVPPEAEDFLFRRLPDEVVEGHPVYVLELFPKPHTVSDYSRLLVSIDKARDIPIRARYWNTAGLAIREVSFPPSRLEQHGSSWFPMLATVRDLRTDEFSRLRVDRFVANPPLTERDVARHRLESH